MPRVNTIQTNFTAGEISPKCYGRTDVSRYQNGARSLSNCLVQIHGGAVRRWGSKFIAESKDSSKASRLIPFIYSVTQSYMLEFGDLYIRFYTASGGQIVDGLGAPIEIVSPYTEAMLSALDYTQGADTMFLFHPDVLPHTLKRITASVWTLQDAPFTTKPFDELGHRFATSLTLSAATVGAGRTATASGATWLPADVGRRIDYEGGLALITGYTSATVVTITIVNAFQGTAVAANNWALLDSPQTALTPSAKDPAGTAITVTAAASAFRSTDVGSFIRINGGLVELTGFTSDLAMGATIRTELASTVASPANAWSLERSVWNSVDGYPSTGTLYEQRLVTGGSSRFPQTIWGSKSGLYFDFTLGDVDDDAFSFTMPSTGQINPITRISAMNALIPLTFGGEFTIVGGVEKPLTPTNRQIKSPSVYGCKNVKPVRIGSELMFVQRSGRKVRAFSFKAVEDTYTSPDLTVLAEHITESGVVDVAYQQEPSSHLWCVLANGSMAVCTVDRDETVIAWAPQETDGLFESVASIPSATGDEVWVIVNRTVDGSTKRYIERFDTDLLTDCAITGTSGPGATIWTGLDHLEGENVVAKSGNIVLGTFTVAAGEIEIPAAVTSIEIGLPYTNVVDLLTPELQAGEGSAQGTAMSTSSVSLLFKDTIGASVNGTALAFRKFDEDLLDTAAVARSGIERMGLSGWFSGESPVTITQSDPLPFHLLAVIRKFTTNS